MEKTNFCNHFVLCVFIVKVHIVSRHKDVPFSIYNIDNDDNNSNWTTVKIVGLELETWQVQI